MGKERAYAGVWVFHPHLDDSQLNLRVRPHRAASAPWQSGPGARPAARVHSPPPAERFWFAGAPFQPGPQTRLVPHTSHVEPGGVSEGGQHRRPQPILWLLLGHQRAPGSPTGSGGQWSLLVWPVMASPGVKAVTHPLTKASCAACGGWQGPWARAQAAGTGDQTRVTFEHTLLFQMTPLRAWAPGVDRRDAPPTPSQAVYLGEGETAGTSSWLEAQSLPRDMCAHISEPTVGEGIGTDHSQKAKK